MARACEWVWLLAWARHGQASFDESLWTLFAWPTSHPSGRALCQEGIAYPYSNSKEFGMEDFESSLFSHACANFRGSCSSRFRLGLAAAITLGCWAFCGLLLGFSLGRGWLHGNYLYLVERMSGDWRLRFAELGFSPGGGIWLRLLPSPPPLCSGARPSPRAKVAARRGGSPRTSCIRSP